MLWRLDLILCSSHPLNVHISMWRIRITTIITKYFAEALADVSVTCFQHVITACLSVELYNNCTDEVRTVGRIHLLQGWNNNGLWSTLSGKVVSQQLGRKGKYDCSKLTPGYFLWLESSVLWQYTKQAKNKRMTIRITPFSFSSTDLLFA